LFGFGTDDRVRAFRSSRRRSIRHQQHQG
jgi:hypothetical protein